MSDLWDKDRYIVQVLNVPQTPVDNQADVVTVYDRITKQCACTNKHRSQFKNVHHAIGMILAEKFK